MKEQIKKIMEHGGYAVLIAVAAMAAYLTAMYYANQYFNKITEPAELEINENGEIYLKGFEAGEDEIIYIMWQTDSGNIKPLEEEKIFKEQYEKKNDNNYYFNSSLDKKIIWDKKDSDGNNYVTSTIRAIVYRYNGKDVYNMENYVNEFTITIESKEGVTKKSKEKRMFSNPIRENGNIEWSQIYILEENDENVTYAYRTGEKIKEDVMMLCWEADKNILRKTDIGKGLNPTVKYNSDEKKLLETTNIVTVQKPENKNENIYAYLINEDAYNKRKEGIDEKEKKNKASFVIK